MKRKFTQETSSSIFKTSCCTGWVVPLSLLFMLFSSNFANAQIQLVKDINQIQDWNYNEYSELTDLNGMEYFIVSGHELWESDGTTEGTVRVKSFLRLSLLTPVSGNLFFAADDGISGLELWKSDGTTAGTVKVRDIRPGIAGSSPYELTASNGALFFIADNGAAGNEVWRSDGTTAGTKLIKDIKAGSGSGNASELTDVNGTVFFSATTGTTGYELWISDGTNSGTKILRDIYVGSTSSFPRKLTNVNGTLFFEATEGSVGRELWKSDGTHGGTVRVKDIRAGVESSFVNKLTAVNNILFFEAHDGIHGKELWKSDGTAAGTVLVKDISPGPSSHAGFAFDHVDNFTNVNGLLYFTAFNNNAHDVWRSDGSEAGTIPLTTGSNVEFGFLNPRITPHDGHAYFFAQQSWEEVQFWKSDGTPGGTAPIEEHFSFFNYGSGALLGASGTHVFAVGGAWDDQSGTQAGYKLYSTNPSATGIILLKDIVAPTLGSDPGQLTDVNGTLFFTANVDLGYQPSLWKSDGTEAGTVSLKHFYSVHDLVEINGKLLFAGYDDDGIGEELWTSDGTPEGTVLVKDIASSGSSTPLNLTNVNGDVLFAATNSSGRGLWKSNGTEAGTVLIKDVVIPQQYASSPLNHLVLNNVFYFEGEDGSSGTGRELWRSDGTTAGTNRIKDINPGAGSSSPQHLTAVGNTLFFAADDGISGLEVWKSDGTEAGTTMVRDIASGTSSQPEELRALNGTLIFTAVTSSGRALWKSDGTEAGTTLLKDFFPGAEFIRVMATIGNEIFILTSATTSETNFELWKSNGTIPGTIKVKDIQGNAYYSVYYTVLNEVLYFSPFGANQFWRTDGTACGTYMIDRGAAFGFELVDSTIFFTGEALPGVGAELYKYEPEASPCTTLASGRSSQQADTESIEATTDEDLTVRVSHYPNPFKSNFSISVSGSEGGAYRVEVINMNGVPVEPSRDLSFNVEYSLGSQWNTGMYIMKAVVDGKLVTRKLVKTN